MIIQKTELNRIEDDLYKLEQRRNEVLLNIGEHAAKFLEGTNVEHHKKFMDNLKRELESIDFLKDLISSWHLNSQGGPSLSEEDSTVFTFWKKYKKVMQDFH